jgi:site-specific recombinase XerD
MSSQSSRKNTLRIFHVVHGQKLEPLTLSFRGFLLDCQSRNLSSGSLRFYRQKLEPLLTFLLALGITDAAQVEPSHLRQWLLHLQDSGHNPGGQHGHFRAARAFFAWLEREGELDASPVRRIKAPRVPEELLEPASLESVRAMLQVCDRKTATGARDYSVLLALADTGARAGEVCATNLGDVDLTTGSILIRRSKSRRPRVVFLGVRSLKALLSYLRFRGVQDDAPLWTAREGGRLSYTGLRDIVRRRAKQVGVEAPTLHSFRRLFALTMLQSGGDLLSVARMLGHGSLGVTQRYIRQTTADLGAVHAANAPSRLL